MPLHPQVEQFLQALNESGEPGIEELGVIAARELDAGFVDLQGQPEPVARVEEVLAVRSDGGGVPVRIYDPAPDENLPLVVYLHGGGFVVGSVNVVDRPCRRLANAAGCVVAAVEYRRSPETKFPGPVEDCYEATKWLAQNGDKIGADSTRLAVAGDSAGANLAAVVALMARDRGAPSISTQLLVYPVTSAAAVTTSLSYTENADGFMLTRAAMEWFWRHYLNSPEDADNPYASPLAASDLSGLPPALVVTAEFDPLRDEGLAYAERLRQAGVAVRVEQYSGAIHGFLWMEGVMDHGAECIDLLAQTLRRQFSL